MPTDGLRTRVVAGGATARSSRLVDRMASLGPVRRSRDPREVERWLPRLLASVADRLRAGLLMLVDGGDRQPWWGCGDPAVLGREMGAPVVSLTAAGGWFSRPVAPR